MRTVAPLFPSQSLLSSSFITAPKLPARQSVYKSDGDQVTLQRFGATDFPKVDPKDPHNVISVEPGSFDIDVHYYREPQQSELHPTVRKFVNMTDKEMVKRYAQLHPKVNKRMLMELLHYKPKHFYWAGGDLFPVTDFNGSQQMVILETNSSPSGQKSRPSGGYGSYEKAMDNADKAGFDIVGRAFVGAMEDNAFAHDKANGRVAVLFDKNYKETTGYAATLADLLKENVLLVPHYRDSPDNAKWGKDGILQVKDEKGKWTPVRAAYRYVTQAPWERIPTKSRTMLFNPILACLAGGRNKAMAFTAYHQMNEKLLANDAGFSINMPKTFNNIEMKDIPGKIKELGGLAVVKVPYSNAGQGVYVISSDDDLKAFQKDQEGGSYQKYIVQELIGPAGWIPNPTETSRFHRGAINFNKKDKEPRVFDMRMMVVRGKKGWEFVTANGRYASKPMTNDVKKYPVSEVLKTNLSVKEGKNRFNSDSSRLIPIHDQGFNKMALSLDDLIEGKIQTVLSAVAIDQLAKQLVDTNGDFNEALFNKLNGKDDSLMTEINKGSEPTKGAFVMTA